ncbi:hypothetical protein JIN85_20075 [Luteolibacter pohnpeiensis]|uniref:Uncharacterized protein n=1 Tax=Luteolibacter pohnpeiensis TaxID=454153 RepID=A0A934VXT8_9BACT|nr:hypothetical protein [Luteolibacter pohnpeiensis]MBK1884720.1 hypothetical protein [Luteolibacter pohnpeiensis]
MQINGVQLVGDDKSLVGFTLTELTDRVKRFFVISILLMTSVFGRVGDSIQECRARYGNLTESTGDTLDKFVLDGIAIACRYSGDKCIMVAYNIKDFSYVNGSISPTGPRFDAKQIEQLLNLNRGGSEWVFEKPNPRGEASDGLYRTKDLARRAIVSFAGIRIEDITWSNAERAKVESDKLQHAVDAITAEDPKDHSGE